MSTRAPISVVTSIFIGAFIVWQMAVPASYYGSEEHSPERFDERFSWRMFSPTRLAHCSVKIGPLDDTGTDIKRIRALREIHPVWNNLLKRGRPAVIDEMKSHFCQISQNDDKRAQFAERQGWSDASRLDLSSLFMDISCQRPDFVRRGICINPSDMDGDGLPDGYQSKPGCYGGKKRRPLEDSFTGLNCFERECGSRTALECFSEICDVHDTAGEIAVCDGFEDTDGDDILDHLVTARCDQACARDLQTSACGTLSPLGCFLNLCSEHTRSIPGICMNGNDRNRDGVPDGYDDPRFAEPGKQKEAYEADCAEFIAASNCDDLATGKPSQAACRTPFETRQACREKLCQTVIVHMENVCEASP